MSRRYDDPVDVRRRDEEPAEFLWRGRLYVIRGVLAHWIETGPWWGSTTSSPERDSVTATPDETADAPVLTLDDAEREVWRVEASPGRAAGSGVYDVVFDWAAGGWTLRRALD